VTKKTLKSRTNLGQDPSVALLLWHPTVPKKNRLMPWTNEEVSLCQDLIKMLFRNVKKSTLIRLKIFSKSPTWPSAKKNLHVQNKILEPNMTQHSKKKIISSKRKFDIFFRSFRKDTLYLNVSHYHLMRTIMFPSSSTPSSASRQWQWKWKQRWWCKK